MAFRKCLPDSTKPAAYGTSFDAVSKSRRAGASNPISKRFAGSVLRQFQTSEKPETKHANRLIHSNRETVDLAVIYSLTGLGNQRRFFYKIELLIGDRAGDDIMIQVAMLLSADCDGYSTVACIGADEHTFFYPRVFSEDVTPEKARMLIEILSVLYDVGERMACMARLPASAGFSLLDSSDGDHRDSGA